MSETFKVVLLGIIEGITEFLPISSTGHLLIAEQWLGVRSALFNVAIQAGAILAVALIFWRRILESLTRLGTAENRDYVAKLAFATGVTLVGGFIATELGVKLPESVVPVAIAVTVGGIAILLIEKLIEHRPQIVAVSWSVALAVGVGQIVAGVFPGTSRSAAAILAAMLAGLTSRPAATEFAFLAGIPTMFAATAYEYLKTRESGGSEDWKALAIGFMVSAVVAFAVVKWLLRYVESHSFTVFAWYRLVLGVVLFSLLALGEVR
jgi:undecaprenyl-diphosphatase